jgi:hypothetical protein
MPELYKSNMASAQVLLGLTPSILARVGPSVYETAPLIASGRRPLLALFLIIGSPAVVVDPSFSFRQQLEDLRDPYKWTSPTSSQRAGIFIFLMEFLVALASTVNSRFRHTPRCNRIYVLNVNCAAGGKLTNLYKMIAKYYFPLGKS